jgi:hypothetical protein
MPGALVCGKRCFAGFRTVNVHVRRVKHAQHVRLQVYLGHRNFQDAVRYTELSPTNAVASNAADSR